MKPFAFAADLIAFRRLCVSQVGHRRLPDQHEPDSNGKAILIISGNNITVQNLEFSGAKVADENGAGIRYEGGNLTIRHSDFHDNEDGILGQGGPSNTLLIERSTFIHNGYCLSACDHN